MLFNASFFPALAHVKSTINPADFEDDEEIEPAVVTNKTAFDSESKNTRATSNASNESTASSRISDFINTARERINSTGLVSGLLTPTPTEKPEDTVQWFYIKLFYYLIASFKDYCLPHL